jgi:hypothetical protein
VEEDESYICARGAEFLHFCVALFLQCDAAEIEEGREKLICARVVAKQYGPCSVTMTAPIFEIIQVERVNSAVYA